jgi:ABC-type uncharacterized transport system permease subunit
MWPSKFLAAMALGRCATPMAAAFPARATCAISGGLEPELIAGTGMHWGVVAAFIAVIFAYVLLHRHILGSGQADRAGAARGALRRRQPGAAGDLLPRAFPARWRGWRGCSRCGPGAQISIDFNVGYGFTAIIVAFLGRLHPVGILLAGLLMALTYIGGELAQFMLGNPAAAIQAFQGMLLFFLLALDMLSNYRLRRMGGGGRRDGPVGSTRGADRRADGAATPILLAAIGELVVEKAGVLNLGVEGMMITGAVCGFAVAVKPAAPRWASWRRAGRGGAVADFAVLTQVLLANQVATGLALTLFGLGLSALIGQGYSASPPRTPDLRSTSAAAGDMPVLGRILFRHDLMVYVSLALVAAVWWC